LPTPTKVIKYFIVSVSKTGRGVVPKMDSIIVIDNFLPNPDEVRKMALSQAYIKNTKETIAKSKFPGARTGELTKINPEYADLINRKLVSAVYNAGQSSIISVKITSEFQYVTGSYGFGKVHRDPADVAAVLYLTPNAPADTGTEFYKQVNYDIPHELVVAYSDVCSSIAMGIPITEEQQKIKDEYLSNYVKTDVVANIYNRIIIYPSNYPHCATRYFGNTLEDARLTQVLFATCEYHNSDFKYKADSIRYKDEYSMNYL
jgi:hypothetical protein